LKDYHKSGFTFTVGNVPFGVKIDNSKRSEVLFCEKCIRLTEVRSTLLVPDSILSCNRDKPFRSWVLAQFGYRSTVSFSSGKGGVFWNSPAKTSAMIIDKRRPAGDYKIFMAIIDKPEEIKQLATEWTEVMRKEG
jgi:hypothetical protein